MKARACGCAILLLGLATTHGAQERERSPLRLPLFPAPIARERIPLSRALDDVGSYVRSGYALFGVELRSKDGKEPVVSLDLKTGSNLGDALKQILDQIPGYNLEVISSHMINIYPAGAKQDPQDFLNTPVPQFDAVNVEPSQVLSRPKDFIPELAARLAPRKTGPPQPSGVFGDTMGGGPRITLHLRNATVRQVLNSVSEAMEKFPADQPPVGWIYCFQEDPTSTTGGHHSWMFLWSAPANWKEEPPKSQ